MIVDGLIEKIIQTKNPTVVGLDPALAYIPAHIKEACFEAYGKTPCGVGHAFYQFNKGIIDAVADIVPAVKPQVAMYEKYGIEGIKAYIDTIAYAKEKGLIVIGDIKRGDIASTAQAYADGHIGVVDIEGEEFEIYKEDWITINPYLGYDSVAPYMTYCKNNEKGLFILVKTSNPNSGQLQDLVCGNKMVYEHVAALVSQWGEDTIGKYGYSSVGAVVGATHPEQIKNLRGFMPHTFFLIPGYGAQGGKAEDIACCFDNNGFGGIVNASRSIMTAYQKEAGKYAPEDFGAAARQAALAMKADLGNFINIQ